MKKITHFVILLSFISCSHSLHKFSEDGLKNDINSQEVIKNNNKFKITDDIEQSPVDVKTNIKDSTQITKNEAHIQKKRINKNVKNIKKNNQAAQNSSKIETPAPLKITLFKEDESITYKAQALGLKAGELNFSVKKNKFIGNKEVLHFTANISSTGLFNSIFKINDFIESYTDAYQFYSYRYHLIGEEGNLIKKKIEIYDNEQSKSIVWQHEEKNTIKKDENKEFKIIPYSQDLLSAFFYIRLNDWNNKKQISFNVISGSNMKKVVIALIDETDTEFILSSYFNDDKIDSKNKIKIFIEKKEPHLINKIIMPLKVGSVELTRE